MAGLDDWSYTPEKVVSTTTTKPTESTGLDDWKFEPKSRRIDDRVSVTDADTIQVGPESIRLQGVNAREVAKTEMIKDTSLLGKINKAVSYFGANATGEPTPTDQVPLLKTGQAGGEEQADAVAQIIKDAGGVKSVVKSGYKSKERDVGDVILNNGESLRERLITNRIVMPSPIAEKGQTGATPEDYAMQYVGDQQRLMRQRAGRASLDDRLMLDIGKQTAIVPKIRTTTAQQAGYADPNYFAGPAIIRAGETATGETTTPWSTGLDIGVESAKQAFYGLAEMVSPAGGPEERWAKRQGRLSQEEQQAMPSIQRMFDRDGNIAINNMNDFGSWVVGNFAQSLPMMGAVLGTAVLAPESLVAGTLVSVGAPGLMYAGQVYGEQDDDKKDSSRALMSGMGQAALERAGLAMTGALKFLPKGFNPDRLFTTEGAKAAAEAVAKAQNVSITQAEKQVGKAVKDVFSETMRAAGKIAEGTVGETATETAQTALELWGQGKLDLSNRYVREQLIEAGAAGGAIGSGISAVTAGYHTFTGGEDSTAEKKSSKDSLARDAYLLKYGRVPWLNEVINEAGESNQSLTDLAKGQEDKESSYRIPGLSRMAESFKREGFKGLYSGWSKSIFSNDTETKGKFTSALMTMLGAANHLNGGNIESNNRIAEANILSNIGTEQDIQNRFNMNKAEISSLYSSALIREALMHLEQARLHEPLKLLSELANQINFKAMLGKHADKADALIETQEGINRAADVYSALSGHHINGMEVLNNRPLNKSAISNNRTEFTKMLVDELEITPGAANKIINRILARNDINHLHDAFNLDFDMDLGDLDFDVSEAEFEPLKLQSLLNKNQEKFSKFLSHDFYRTMTDLASRGANKHIKKNYLDKVPALLQAAIRHEGMSEEQASFIAKQVKDFMQMQTGDYHRLPETFNTLLTGASTMMTLSVLPLAAVSSMVEWAQVTRSLGNTEKEAGKLFFNLLNETAQEYAAALQDAAYASGVASKRKVPTHTQALMNAGFIQQTAAQRNDLMQGSKASSTRELFQSINTTFFKYTGLEAITNATRAVRLGLADDAINNWLDTYYNNADSPAGRSARENLIRIGIDADYIKNAFIEAEAGNLSWTDKDQQNYDRMIQLGRFNFVNEAVVSPSALNRPKFFSDPYLKMFTMLQGYTSAFTAQVLPRLYQDLAARGTQEQKDAIKTVAYMAALSMLAITTKDLVKDAFTPDDKEDKRRKMAAKAQGSFRRFIDTMGLLGTGQIPLDMLMLAKKKGIDTELITSRAPVLAYTSNFAKAAFNLDQLGTDKAQQEKKRIAALVPGGSVLKNVFN